ncbi:MAG: hypothetical protein ACJAU2_001503, partial [Maribacter sp.]
MGLYGYFQGSKPSRVLRLVKNGPGLQGKPFRDQMEIWLQMRQM